MPDPAAQDTGGSTEAADSPSPESAMSFGETGGGSGNSVARTGDVVRMVLILALAAAAIYGVIFFLKRASRRRGQSNPYLKILSSAQLGAGANRFVHIISVGSQAWLVGSGEGGVTLISEIGDKEVIDALLLDESRRNVDASPGRMVEFQSLLRRFGVGGASRGEPDDQGLSPENLRRRRERLKGL
ncbi:MAG: flagellar biosynthetic protein FliO [Treponema sp.]|nr:flagellar biosynthetic protein FliO [Treponema sp.]